MQPILTKYLSVDEYNNMRKTQLSSLLNTTECDEKIIEMATDDIENYIFDKFRVNVDFYYNGLNDREKILFKKAIASQVDYILENGHLINDSGYNSETGIKTDLSDIYICEASKLFLKRTRLQNRVITRRRRYIFNA